MHGPIRGQYRRPSGDLLGDRAGSARAGITKVADAGCTATPGNSLGIGGRLAIANVRARAVSMARAR